MCTAFIAATCGAVISGCGGPPQMGRDREVFRTIDALYTAISMREPAQLERCSTTLSNLNASGRLASRPHESVKRYVDDAREGRWESAQAGLRDFMLAQRP